MFFEAHFGEVELHMPEDIEEPEQGEDKNEPSLLVRLDEAEARINLVSLTVTSNYETLRKRVEAVLDMALTTVSSLAESFVSAVPVSGEDASLNKEVQLNPSPPEPPEMVEMNVDKPDVPETVQGEDTMQADQDEDSETKAEGEKSGEEEESDESDYELKVHD